jgi:acetyltransferase-like isoleucine patch superfamily enzyme
MSDSLWLKRTIRAAYTVGQGASTAVRTLGYRLVVKRVGRKVRISKGSVFSCPRNLVIGNHVFMNVGCLLHAEGGLTIGDGTEIGPYSIIWTTNHIFDDGQVPIRSQGERSAPVVIEAEVWLGAGVTILPGVTVGHGAVIGAGSVVTRDVPPLAVVAGNPARVIKSRSTAASAGDQPANGAT